MYVPLSCSGRPELSGQNWFRKKLNIGHFEHFEVTCCVHNNLLWSFLIQDVLNRTLIGTSSSSGRVGSIAGGAIS